jgi:hypothetical protein
MTELAKRLLTELMCQVVAVDPADKLPKSEIRASTYLTPGVMSFPHPSRAATIVTDSAAPMDRPVVGDLESAQISSGMRGAMGLSQAGFAFAPLVVSHAIRNPKLTVACLAPALMAATLLTLLTTPSVRLPSPASDRASNLQAQRPLSMLARAPLSAGTLANTDIEFLERITQDERLIQLSTTAPPLMSWVPAGGMSVLSYGIPIRAAARASEDRQASEIPLPAPSPLAGARPLARSPASTSPDERLGKGDPDAAQDKSFNLLGWLLTPRDYAAKQMLASNPQTAIYEIAARKVYLPGGLTLEAHSGFGEWMDNPTSVARRGIGVTPPNVYKVSLRSTPFHGVRALRLIPEDQSKMFGRSGFLAHPFMLGETGQSNGCVSIKDYDAFLRAYQDGKVTRLIVVPKFDDKIIASANGDS